MLPTSAAPLYIFTEASGNMAAINLPRDSLYLVKTLASSSERHIIAIGGAVSDRLGHEVVGGVRGQAIQIER